MDNLSKLIRIYDNALEKSVCDTLVEVYENNSDSWERIDSNRKPNFTQLNLISLEKNDLSVNNLNKYLIAKMMQYKNDYLAAFGLECFPVNYFYEEFRIKKYNNDGHDAFDEHVDVMDHNSSKRFLSFFWYLNDVKDGGETTFWNDRVKINPIQGRLVIFPPLWMFPHSGKEPVSSTKYLLSTYLHYQ